MNGWGYALMALSMIAFWGLVLMAVFYLSSAAQHPDIQWASLLRDGCKRPAGRRFGLACGRLDELEPNRPTAVWLVLVIVHSSTAPAAAV